MNLTKYVSNFYNTRDGDRNEIPMTNIQRVDKYGDNDNKNQISNHLE